MDAVIKPLHIEVAEAIVTGLGGPEIASMHVVEDATPPYAQIWTEDMSDPIIVVAESTAIILAGWAKELAPGIRLDVQAILASRTDTKVS